MIPDQKKSLTQDYYFCGQLQALQRYDTVQAVETGKCKDCRLEVLGIDLPENLRKIKMYDIAAVPTIVIDEKSRSSVFLASLGFVGTNFTVSLGRSIN